jgi:hypothetical protein
MRSKKANNHDADPQERTTGEPEVLQEAEEVAPLDGMTPIEEQPGYAPGCRPVFGRG